MRKQSDRYDASNAPESEALTLADIEVFENARSAVNVLKKTFDTWIMIGRAVARARTIANDRGGGKTFMRLIEQQGLAKMVDKATASRLERIMDHLPAVTAWHETLTDRQKFDWAAPTTVIKRCPVFKKSKPDADATDKPPRKQRIAFEPALDLISDHLRATDDADHRAAMVERIRQVVQIEDGDRWKPTDTARDIATVLVGTVSPSKATEIARHIMALVKERDTDEQAKSKRRNTPDDTRRKLDAKLKAEQAKPGKALAWRQSPGGSRTHTPGEPGAASPEFYLEADGRAGHRYMAEPSHFRSGKVTRFHMKKVPPTPSNDTPILWLGKPRSLEEAKAIAQADYDLGD